MVELTVAVTDDLAKLHLREADVVIRITQTPPDGAVGRVLATSPLTLYAAPSYLAQRPVLDRWVALAYAPVAQPWGAARVTARTDSALTAAEMIRKGAGIGGLPCYLGDPDPHLARVPGAELRPDMTIWALTHDEVRSNPRVRALINFLYKTFASLRPLIEGQRPG
jgi:DNA-binding transcriptional LysR family regulator